MKLKTSLFVTAAAAAMAANMAAANPMDNTKLTFGYDSYSSDYGDGDGMWLRGDTNVDLGGIDLDLGASHGDIGGDDAATSFSVAPKFDLGGGIKAGAFLDYTMIDDDDDTTAMHYGATGEYVTGDLTVSGYAGLGSIESAADMDTTVYGVAANYDLAGAFDAGAFYNAELADAGDVTEMGVSVGYDLQGFVVPSYVVASYSLVDNAGSDDTKMGLTMTVPLGNSGKADRGVVKAHKRSVMVNGSFLSAK
jgi:hypothetical protein